MKRIFTTLFACVAFAGFNQAQDLNTNQPCHTEIMFQEMAKENPQLLIDRQNYEAELAKFLKANPDFYSTQSAAPRIIPVVFHVMHDYGTENIARTQILDGIRVLNQDFHKLNPDTTNCPAPFKSLIGDGNIEFRLAQKDPNGNCTDGVVRYFTPLTNFTRNNVKSLSYWPSNQYLNIWTVKFIDPQNAAASPGTYIVGFAQFPGGSATTDGIVLRHESVGVIGTASGQNTHRTPTHEAGHWFNLRHIWGDATCGDDLVNDTPTHEAANQSNCPTFPKISNCSGSAPNGDMFTNYMDYTRSNCQNMFSKGQVARIDAALTNTSWTRRNLYTSTNMAATGTDGTAATPCAPIADFNTPNILICSGTSLTLSDLSYNNGANALTGWTWTTPGGTPATSNTQNPSVTYNTPGVYNVSLQSSGPGGTSAVKTKTGYITVVSPTATNTVPITEGFESTTFPPDNNWITQSIDATTWSRTTAAAATGSASSRVNCFVTGSSSYATGTGSKDVLITPSFDLTGVVSSTFNFKVAYAQTAVSSVGTDKLSIAFSTDCGRTWTTRRTINNTALATVATAVTSSFVPSSTQWRTETVSIVPAHGKNNVRFRFEFSVGRYSNNIYIDDINLQFTVGINDELMSKLNFSIYPNPTDDNTNVNFTLAQAAQVKLKLYDIVGKEIAVLNNGQLAAGEHTLVVNKNNELPSGIYFVKMTVNDKEITQKLVIK